MSYSLIKILSLGGMAAIAGSGLVYFSFFKETPEARKAREYREIAARVNKDLQSAWWFSTLPDPEDSWWTMGASLPSGNATNGTVSPIPPEAKKDATTFMKYCYGKIKDYKSYPKGDKLLSECLKPMPLDSAQ